MYPYIYIHNQTEILDQKSNIAEINSVEAKEPKFAGEKLPKNSLNSEVHSVLRCSNVNPAAFWGI